MSTYVGLTNFQKQSGFLAHPVVLCCAVSVEHGIAFILKKNYMMSAVPYCAWVIMAKKRWRYRNDKINSV